MTYTPAQKIQKEAITEYKSMMYTEYGDMILICTKCTGVYIRKSELIIDLSKIKRMQFPATEMLRENVAVTRRILDPIEMLKRTDQAKLKEKEGSYVRECRYEREDGIAALINERYIKFFGVKARVYVESPNMPVLITTGRKFPLGLILPIKKYE